MAGSGLLRWATAAVTPAAVVLCAILAATSVSHAIEARYLLDSAEAPSERPVAQSIPHEPTRTDVADGTALVERNMFCAACTAVSPPPPPGGASGIAVTALPLNLVATHLTEPAEHSFATVEHRGVSRPGAYAVGERIPGAGVVAEVSRRFVDFRNDSSGRIERILLEPLAVAKADTRPPRRTAGHRPRNRIEALAEEGIRQVDDVHYELDRDLVNELRENPMLARGLRARPAIDADGMVGVRIYGVRRRSIAARLGWKNGDTIRSVNGIELTGPDAYLDAFSRLSTLDHFTVRLVRRGSPLELDYRVR